MDTTESMANAPLAERDWRAADRAMAWYGWGSPVGLGLFLICVSVTVALIRYALWG